MLAAAAGDQEAFRRLVEPIRRELHLFCYRMLGSFEDIATNASLDALRSFALAFTKCPWLLRTGSR